MEEARRALDISRDEYALCSYVLYRQASSRATVPGWCCDPKDSVADFVGVSRPGLYKMIDRMEAKGLMETNPANGVIRTTAVFMDAENGCKQSLHFEKTDRKQSLHSTVNKVYTPGAKSVNKVTPIYRNKEDNISKSKYDIVADAPTENQTVFSVEIFEPSKTEILTLETENTPPPQIAPPPPAPRRAKDSRTAEQIAQVVEIVDYLNSKAGTRHRPNTGDTAKFICARIADGYTPDDMKTVIDHRVKIWLGTSHQIYLRPETLFCQKHFDGYLNAARMPEPKNTGAPKKQAVNDVRGIDYSRPQKF